MPLARGRAGVVLPVRAHLGARPRPVGSWFFNRGALRGQEAKHVSMKESLNEEVLNEEWQLRATRR